MAAKKVVPFRLSTVDLDWIDGYARQRGITRQQWIDAALESFKADCESGVPEFKERARRQAESGGRGGSERDRGVGVCPERLPGLGHVWAGVKASGDSSNPCVFCGASGREFFKAATADRSDLFAVLAAGMENGTGKVEKAYPKGMPPARAAKAAEIVAEKKARDAEAKVSRGGER